MILGGTCHSNFAAGPMSTNPEMGLVFFGVAQAKPWMSVSRGMSADDAALYSNSTLAIDPSDGRNRQHVPGESLDMDEAFDLSTSSTSLTCSRSAWHSVETRSAQR